MDKPLIIVDGMPVSSRDYANFLQSHPTIVSRAVNSEQGKAEALRELVSVYLLRKAMVAEGLLNKSESSPSAKEITQAYERLAEKHFPIPPAPSEKEGYQYYQTHQGEFGIPTMVRLNQILFKIPSQADAAVQDAVKQRAEKALKRLEDGEKFSDIATELTEYPIGKVAGGDIGFVNPEEEEWMRSALKDLKTGQRTGVVKSPAGFVILQLTEIRPGLTSPYANVRDRVIKSLMDTEQKRLRDSYIKALAKDVKIEIVMPDIKNLFPKGMFP
jgi:parvulin-like peptidyl-prolyl isomerase